MTARRIKILHAIRQGTFGGGETYLYNLVTRLDASRFEPIVLSFTEGAMVERLRRDGIPTFVIPTLRPFDVTRYGAVRRLLQSERVDLLHIHGTRAGTNTLIPALINKTKSIYTVHGWSFHTGNNRLVTRSRILAEQFLTRFADQTICGSRADMAQGKRHCPAGNYELIYNRIDPDVFNPTIPAPDIRREFGFTETDFIVSFVARLTFQKDPLTFIQAIPRVVAQLPQAKFLVVGDGELQAPCVQLAESLNIREKIVFSPFRRDVKSVLQLTDVFVMPSRWEVIPLGLLEAMAMEKSCVATAIDGTTEALTDEQNGLLVAVENPDQLAEKIIRLAQDGCLRNRLGKHARQTVVNQFNIRMLVQQNEAIYAHFGK